MDEKVKRIYSEVNSVLNMLGEEYIQKLPKNLYDLVKSNQLEGYNPTYIKEKDLSEQNIQKESLSMIALFHLNYWCETEQEKQELKKLLSNNEEKYKKELEEKYSYDNLFKNKSSNITQETENKQEQRREQTDIKIVPKESFIQKIVNLIKNLFKRK